MDIGTNDVEFYDEEFNDVTQQDTLDDLDADDSSYEQDHEEDFLDSLLRTKGIEDKNRIKFEDEYGSEEELSWDQLSKQEKLNIINQADNDPDVDLDESEIELINSIRNSNMTPREYLQYVQNSTLQNYVQNMQQPVYDYSTDQYSDDELFLMDFIARTGNVTDEEAIEALENAKSNEALFAKQMGAIRNEYKTREDEINQQAYAEQEQYAQAQYNQFANSVADQINGLTEIAGYDLNLDQEEMQQLYDFITGVDAAGNNHFAKALANPETLVRLGYFALNYENMINEITNYYNKEITQVRKQSYEKGRNDALNKMNNSNMVFKSNSSRRKYNDELDDF